MTQKVQRKKEKKIREMSRNALRKNKLRETLQNCGNIVLSHKWIRKNELLHKKIEDVRGTGIL